MLWCPATIGSMHVTWFGVHCKKYHRLTEFGPGNGFAVMPVQIQFLCLTHILKDFQDMDLGRCWCNSKDQLLHPEFQLRRGGEEQGETLQ